MVRWFVGKYQAMMRLMIFVRDGHPLSEDKAKQHPGPVEPRRRGRVEIGLLSAPAPRT